MEKWDEIHGVGGSVGGVINGCIVDNGCGSNWVARNVLELCGVICGCGVSGWCVEESGGIYGIKGGGRA